MPSGDTKTFVAISWAFSITTLYAIVFPHMTMMLPPTNVPAMVMIIRMPRTSVPPMRITTQYSTYYVYVYKTTYRSFTNIDLPKNIPAPTWSAMTKFYCGKKNERL